MASLISNVRTLQPSYRHQLIYLLFPIPSNWWEFLSSGIRDRILKCCHDIFYGWKSIQTKRIWATNNYFCDETRKDKIFKKYFQGEVEISPLQILTIWRVTCVDIDQYFYQNTSGKPFQAPFFGQKPLSEAPRTDCVDLLTLSYENGWWSS